MPTGIVVTRPNVAISITETVCELKFEIYARLPSGVIATKNELFPEESVATRDLIQAARVYLVSAHLVCGRGASAAH